MKCCGHEVTTAFCPNCGAKGQPPAESLLRYLEGQVKSVSQNLNKHVATMQKSQVSDEQIDDDAKINKARKVLAKWQAWVVVVKHYLILTDRTVAVKGKSHGK